MSRKIKSEMDGVDKNLFSAPVVCVPENAPAESAPAVSEEVEISPRTGKPIDKSKSHGRNRRVNKKSPVIGMNGYNLEEGDNNKFLQLSIELFNMPDIDKYELDQVNQRLSEYFALYAKYDMKPTVAGMASALGMNRRTLLAIVNDYATGSTGYKSALPKAVTQTIKKAYDLLETMWENYMSAGKLNPVTGIFLAKNNYGYQDKTEWVVTPNSNTDEEYSVEEIRKRYIVDDPERLSEKNEN